MKKFRVLVVDDEERIVNFLRSKLTASGYEVVAAGDGYQGLEEVRSREPDLVVMDLVMPRMDGLTALEELRTFSGVPVIILSAKGADADKIRSLALGADDYISKPFNPDELVARIEALRRRLGSGNVRKVVPRFCVGDLTVDLLSRRVTVGQDERHLTRIEWLLLSELVHNQGRLMMYEELLSRVWGPEFRDDVQLLRTWMSRLRLKLSGDRHAPSLIRTAAKSGYIIDQPLN